MNPKPWTKEDEVYLEKHFTDLSFQEMADALNRTLYSVKSKAARMGLQKTVRVSGGKPENNKMRRCPQCRASVRLENDKCWYCRLKLHTIVDCAGCGEKRGGRCLAYKNPANPILRKDGTCLGKKKLPWVDV